MQHWRNTSALTKNRTFGARARTPRIIEITVAEGKLYAELKGREKIQLVAQSDTYFTGFVNWQVEFIPGPNGLPAYLNEVHVSGNYKYRRVK